MVDPRAVIAAGAKIADDVDIGAYSVIGEHVSIDSGTWVGPHVVINGHTTIGKHNKIYQFASVGEAPQDKKYADELTYLEIGDFNVIRESVTVHRGTAQDRGITKIGHGNLLMAYVHIAHDCHIGDHNIFANCAAIAGHVNMTNHIIVSAFCGIHQFCHIGEYSFLSHASLVSKDVPPYVMITGGNKATVCGLNIEGLKRQGFSSETINQLRQAYKVIYRQSLRTSEAIEKLHTMSQNCAAIEPLTNFLRHSTRGIIR